MLRKNAIILALTLGLVFGIISIISLSSKKKDLNYENQVKKAIEQSVKSTSLDHDLCILTERRCDPGAYTKFGDKQHG